MAVSLACHPGCTHATNETIDATKDKGPHQTLQRLEDAHDDAAHMTFRLLSLFVYIPYHIMVQIETAPLEFPTDATAAASPGLKRLLSGMLVKDPTKRLRLEQVRSEGKGAL